MLNDYVPMNNNPNGMYNNYNISPNPMGNVMNVGSGYNNTNNGYYNSNNMYNNYFNPYLAIQQNQAREAQMKEQQRTESDMMKRISRAVNKASGSEISDDTLGEIYDYKEPEQYKVDPDSVEYMQSFVASLYITDNRYLPQDIQFVNRFNQMYDQAKQMCPDDISMYDYNQKMSEQYVQMLIDNNREKQRDVSKLYNSNDYNKLLNMNSKSSSYFNSIFNGGNMNNNVSVDDMEVTLPNHLANEYQSRRKQFLESILS